MTPQWLAEFAGVAAIYAALATALLLGAARLFGWVDAWRFAPVLVLTLFFVILTQHPFPSIHDLKCPVASATPQLQPFKFWDTVQSLAKADRGPLEWLSNRTIAASAMNFVICMLIGLALRRHVDRFVFALGFAAGLTLAVELTQLTGIWGLYPCAYRQFDVDDLLLNVLGLAAGFAAAGAALHSTRPRGPRT